MKHKICVAKLSDVEMLNAIRTDDNIYKNILSLTSESVEETKNYFFDEVLYKENLVIKINDKTIGYIQLRRSKEKRKLHKANLSIAILKKYHHMGYGTLLMKQMINIAKNQLGLKKLELTVLETNKNALALYKKCGFEIEGLRTFDTIVDGKYESVYLLGLIL